jgi:hypothetical protein
MKAERCQTDQLFLSGLTRAPAERAAFLDQACVADGRTKLRGQSGD